MRGRETKAKVIKDNVLLDITRDELMMILQMYFEKLYDTRVVIRGRTRRGGGAYYLSLPVEFVRKYNLNGKRFSVKIKGPYVIYYEDQKGMYDVKNFGSKRWPSYYILFPLKKTSRVKIFVENEDPLEFMVIMPA